jgi:probable addiction module antidote protein
MSRPNPSRRIDAAPFFSNDTKTASFLADALESGDTCEFLEALQTAARARGIAAIAEASGLGRESLYKALRPDAHPRFDTVRRVLEAMGIRLSFSAQAVRTRSSHAVNETRGRYAAATAKRASRTHAAAPAKKPGAAAARSTTKSAAKSAASRSKAAGKRTLKTRKV